MVHKRAHTRSVVLIGAQKGLIEFKRVHWSLNRLKQENNISTKRYSSSGCVQFEYFWWRSLGLIGAQKGSMLSARTQNGKPLYFWSWSKLGIKRTHQRSLKLSYLLLVVTCVEPVECCLKFEYFCLKWMQKVFNRP